MAINANSHPYKVVVGDGTSPIYANRHPIKVEIEGGVVTPAEFEELEAKVDALATDLTYKGSVPTYNDLPETADDGDTYLVEDTGVLYTWADNRFIPLNDTRSNTIVETSAPTTSTEGEVGQFYVDTTTGKVYVLTAISGNTYTWVSLDSPIQSISVNGTAVTPDENKNVALTIPEGVKTLTTADYNYPTTGTKTQLAISLMEPGLYKAGEQMALSRDGGSTYNLLKDEILAVTSTYSGQRFAFFTQSGNMITAPYNVTGFSSLVDKKNVADNLTTTSSNYVLSAPQGKVLNDKIEGRLKTNAGAPTTSTTGTKGQLLEDTTNGNLYICTDATNPYVWKQVDKDEILTNAGAPTTSTAGTLGQLLTDTTNAKLYQLTAIDTTDPQNPSYTWSEVGGGPTVVQTTGTSTTDVMSQNAVTSMVFADPADARLIKIGYNANVESSATSDVTVIGAGAATTQRRTLCLGPGTYTIGENAICISARDNGGLSGGVKAGTIMIGGSHFNQTGTDTVIIGNGVHNTSADSAVMLGASASATGLSAVAIGANATATQKFSVAVGDSSRASNRGALAIGGTSSGIVAEATAINSIAIGSGARATTQGEMNIGASYDGYNNSAYRLISGVYDGQSAHDAATKGQLDNAILNGGTTAPTASTAGAVGTQYTYVDTTGTTPVPHLMVCTAVDTSVTPNTYTWVDVMGSVASALNQVNNGGN